GETVCSPCVAGTLFRRVAALSRARTPAAQAPRLTSREVEILRLVARGLSNKEIARILCVQPSTVKNHVHRFFEKLGIHRRDQVGAWLDAYDGDEAREY